MTWTSIFGYVAALAVLATFCMKTMRPLRIVALGSNVLFAIYGFYGHIYPVLALHLVLFPINLTRLFQVQRMIRRVEGAAASELSIADILPLMRRHTVHAGEPVVKKGDLADRLYYIGSGTMQIRETGFLLKAGDVFGEIGLFAPDQKRTATISASTDCELYYLAEASVRELYFQNPAFGFAILRLIVTRLLENERTYQLRSGGDADRQE